MRSASVRQWDGLWSRKTAVISTTKNKYYDYYSQSVSARVKLDEKRRGPWSVPALVLLGGHSAQWTSASTSTCSEPQPVENLSLQWTSPWLFIFSTCYPVSLDSLTTLLCEFLFGWGILNCLILLFKFSDQDDNYKIQANTG